MDRAVAKDFVDQVNSGLYEEFQIVVFIMEYLVNPEQGAWMNEHKLSIQDILNGRFPGSEMGTVEAMLTDWNLKLGSRLFHF